MSQHVTVQGQTKFVFGWDQPLMSFFLQVHDLSLPEDDEERIVAWLGATADTKMYEVEELVKEAMFHGLDVPYRVQVELYGEKDDGS